MRTTVFLLLLFFLTTASYTQQTELRSGMKITHSVVIRQKVYSLQSTVTGHPVLEITGDNITIDFNGAVLQGSVSGQSPDSFKGLALFIHDSKKVTIKNLSAKGYKIAILARNTQNLTIEACDFSYNYRPHLNSTQEKEDLSDWMSYHQNEQDEWLRYGAAMYLRFCNNAVIKNCTVTNGQNALMLMECNDGLIYNNNFSFNSGIGLGLYHSSNNKVLHNRIIFNVRGYSHGVYNRGQDSAGILVYEQSSNNLFYKNNVTHGGDGFFLWAGQTTMDSGGGGCNDNVLLENDFSYAPTNGIEVTFSRNKIKGNRIVECDHGIWGGYSFNTTISNNQFDSNRIAIAIEHGQENAIFNNKFETNKQAIRLWARTTQPSDWGYARYRDTRSRKYAIFSNQFYDQDVAVDMIRTDSVNAFNNTFSNTHTLFKIDSTVTHFDTTVNKEIAARFAIDAMVQLPTIAEPINPFEKAQPFAGRKNIRITEWGPYNFQYPILWNTNSTDSSGVMQFELLAPAGTWKIVATKGIENLSSKAGTFPATVTAQKAKDVRTDIEIIAEYTGPAFTDAFGNKIAATKPYRFVFKKFFQPIDWIVAFSAFDSTTNPIKEHGVLKKLAATPFKKDTVAKLDYAWWGGIEAGGKNHLQFATIAQGKASLLPGVYQLGVTWDDAVRVYVDDRLVLDEWNPALYKFDESPNKKITLRLSGGLHRFRVEHIELGGFATLSVRLNKIQ